ncbi:MULTISPECIES: glutathione S-transferase family protein [Cyanophyceae]|uniref:glutathione S-transferase family protein n=1 Tax=Cyanophyceae TaxID=3028117 RepID=UPI00232F1EDD|nr:MULTISPECIES: glutathione S-transferase family protein [Cyanophyceae]MDB9356983.1 glutathione S-transferase family protein [Nodularia spumigena CS-587/03]MDB9305665.1 glutathione S-transferase family protein [Nodularia spumigena CS-591/12]MDB9322694.1 glutathione S-transferase family protein [Nodularia spumigena CS-591/07A]MDB9329947.1 glutathione S-transferase family protein [Nodularia spumigena CS-591/04]MDB9341570.1 glutathione S-transferase family protein [Nodularia spumigena CS-589/07]
MLKLYGGARSRASIVQWYLEELGVSYEFVMLDMQAGEHKQPEYLKINPMAKVPAIVDGDFQLWESGAILLYIADKYGKTPLSLEDRGIFSQWVLFGNSTLATGIFLEANREREMPRLLTPLNEIFERQSFLLGEEFTVADVAVGSMLAYIPIMLKLDLSDYPGVLNYIKRMSERPAFQKSIGGQP